MLSRKEQMLTKMIKMTTNQDGEDTSHLKIKFIFLGIYLTRLRHGRNWKSPTSEQTELSANFHHCKGSQSQQQHQNRPKKDHGLSTI